MDAPLQTTWNRYAVAIWFFKAGLCFLNKCQFNQIQIKHMLLILFAIKDILKWSLLGYEALLEFC